MQPPTHRRELATASNGRVQRTLSVACVALFVVLAACAPGGHEDAGARDAGFDAGDMTDAGGGSDAGLFAIVRAERIGGPSEELFVATSFSDGGLWIGGHSFADPVFGDPDAPDLALDGGGEHGAFLVRAGEDGGYVPVLRVVGSRDNGIGEIVDLPDGAIVIGGFLGAAAHFQTEDGTDVRCVDDGSGGNAYVAQVSRAGHLDWARCFGSDGILNALESHPQIAMASDGAVFAVTYSSGDAVVDLTGDAVTPIAFAGSGHGLLLKFSPSGEPLWALRMGASSLNAFSILAPGDGTIVVAGAFADSLTIVDRFASQSTITGSSSELFLARLDEDGALLAAVAAGGPGAGRWLGRMVILDNGDLALTTGMFEGATFPSAEGPIAVGAGGIVARYGDDLELRSVRALGSGGESSVLGLVGDGVGGFYVHATLSADTTLDDGTAIIRRGPRDAVVVHFDASGRSSFVVRAGSPGVAQTWGGDLTRDGSGRLALGWSWGAFDTPPGASLVVETATERVVLPHAGQADTAWIVLDPR